MAVGKLSPRQKMINMMYLVLTALLALNVSKEVLNSFFEVNLGIVKTTQGLDKKNNETYSSFVNATNQEKVKNHRKLAEQVRPEANQLIDFIQEMKYTLVLTVDEKVFLGEHKDENGEEIEENTFTKPYSELDDKDKKKKISFLNVKDDRHASGEIFNPENKQTLPTTDGEGIATRLKNNIISYKEFLLNTLYEARDSSWVYNNGTLSSLIEEINTTLGIEDGEVYGERGNKRTWEYHNFYDMPAVGVHTILSKWQGDVRNMESAVISFLASNIDASSLKFTNARATTIPSSNFILRGDEFKSEIFLTAFDETSNPEIFVGDYEILEDGRFQLTGDYDSISIENGKGFYTTKGTRVGKQTYKGFIKILQDEGNQYYPFSGEYLVADKSFAVSATQMNVLYANDIANPIKVSVAGYQPEDISIRFSAGSVKTVNRKKGEYIVKPNQKYVGAGSSKKPPVTISVSVKKKNGKSEPIGKAEFRVKNVPGQTIGARYSDGIHGKNEIIANTFKSFIENFDFPIKFYVSEFTVVSIGSKRIETKVKGYKLSTAARNEIDKLTKGQTVLFKDFVVKQKGVPTYIDRPKDKFELIIE